MPHPLLHAAGARGQRVSSTFATLLFCGLTVGACVGTPSDGLDEPLGEGADAIINGAPDTTHQAVVAVLANTTACTGTIIHTDPAQGIGHVLTAAHCQPPVEVRLGNDYQSPNAVFGVVDWANHPNYDTQSQLFDFKMVRISGVSAATPVIPAMTPAQDSLGSGTQVRHVGYGKSGPPPGSDNNTIRRHILGNLSGVSSTQIFYDQPSGGPCFGDSGGPQLTVGTERVAGVTSYGDENCAVSGVSGRVSGVYDTFIIPYINNAPTGPLDCDGCFAVSTSGQGICVPPVDACLNSSNCTTLLNCFDGCGTNNACVQGCVNDNPTGWNEYKQILDCVCDTGCSTECGGEPFCQNGTTTTAATSVTTTATTTATGATTGTAGVGGSGAGGDNGNGWSSGDIEDENYDGYVFSSCSASAAGGTNNPWHGLFGLAIVGLAGIGFSRRGCSRRGCSHRRRRS